MNPSLKRSLWCRWSRREPPREPYVPPEGSYVFITCAGCGMPVEGASNWTRDGSAFRCERCG